MSSSHPTNNIIAGTLRTLVQLVPMAGGAIAQAWSEYESFHQNQRVEHFFSQLATHLSRLESEHSDLKSFIQSMPDAAALLEKCVTVAQRETSDMKRALYSKLYSNFLAAPSVTSPDERTDLVHHIEQLNEGDLSLLSRFLQSGGTMRGDVITDTVHAEWLPIGHSEPDSQWLVRHGSTVHSLAKLVARGLVYDSVINAEFESSGDDASTFNRFRRKTWTITPMGRKLLTAIKI